MSLRQSYKIFVKYATFSRLISPYNGIFCIKSHFWRRLSTCSAFCCACPILGNSLRTKDEIFVFEEFTIINIHSSAIVEEGGGAEERACHVLRLFSISLFVRLFVCLARAYVREEKCCKFLQMKIFQVFFLVFWLKSDGISCMSTSYVGFGAFFMCFLGLLVEKRWNIVHVNKLRGFWSIFRVFC